MDGDTATCSGSNACRSAAFSDATLACDGEGACQESTLACAAGRDCAVACTGSAHSTCEAMTIDGRRAASLDVEVVMDGGEGNGWRHGDRGLCGAELRCPAGDTRCALSCTGQEGGLWLDQVPKDDQTNMTNLEFGAALRLRWGYACPVPGGLFYPWVELTPHGRP